MTRKRKEEQTGKTAPFFFEHIYTWLSKNEFEEQICVIRGKMLGLKALRPSLREKKRYIVYEITSDSKLNMFNMQQALVKKLNELLGVFDSARAGILPIKIDKQRHRGILRTNHTAVERIRACFVLIDSLEGQKVQIKTLGVSGIIKKAKAQYFEPEQPKKTTNQSNSKK